MDILSEIREERRRQDAKWGEQNHSPIEWSAILTEEAGEVAKEALELHFAQLQHTGQSEAWLAEKLAAYRKEVIQVAAVALAMAESLERNKWKALQRGESQEAP